MPEADMCDNQPQTRWEAPLSSGCQRSGLYNSQGRRWRDTSKRRRPWLWSSWWWIALVWMISCVSPAAAVLLNFNNCLGTAIIESSPLQLQFVPLDVDVKFNLANSLYPLNVTVYGNVSGTADRRSKYPSPNNPKWKNSSDTVGKIVDLSTSNNKYTTLLTSFQVLNFYPYIHASRFCTSLTRGECPLGPVFYANA